MKPERHGLNLQTDGVRRTHRPLSLLRRPVLQVLGRDKESDPLDWVMSEPNRKLTLDFRV